MLMCFYKLLNCRHIFFLNYKLFVITIIPIMIPVQTLNFISRNILPFFSGNAVALQDIALPGYSRCPLEDVAILVIDRK